MLFGDFAIPFVDGMVLSLVPECWVLKRGLPEHGSPQLALIGMALQSYGQCGASVQEPMRFVRSMESKMVASCQLKTGEKSRNEKANHTKPVLLACGCLHGASSLV